MTDLIFAQTLNGLASASSLFLVACGLSIIFGVTRIVNFAHGSFYMLGAYLAFTLVSLGAWLLNHYPPATGHRYPLSPPLYRRGNVGRFGR